MLQRNPPEQLQKKALNIIVRSGNLFELTLVDIILQSLFLGQRKNQLQKSRVYWVFPC